MLIALDYDDTFTRDPLGWQSVCELLKARGHTIIGATMRYGREASGMLPVYEEICERIVFTGRQAKRKYLAQNDIFPDVWIDDCPEFIFMSAIRKGVSVPFGNTLPNTSLE